MYTEKIFLDFLPQKDDTLLMFLEHKVISVIKLLDQRNWIPYMATAFTIHKHLDDDLKWWTMISLTSLMSPLSL